MTKFKTIFLFFVLLSTTGYGQDCCDLLDWNNFGKNEKNGYRIFMQPRNSLIDVNDTLKFNIVFFGMYDYILTFCADTKYYPLKIRLLQQANRKELYNNINNSYRESIGVGLYNAQNLILEVTLQSGKLEKDKIKSEDKVCVGLIMQWKRMPSKIKITKI